MSSKTAFVFDTNFIIQNKELDEVLDKLAEQFTVYISQVSIDERIAQECRELQKDFDEAERCKVKFIRFATIDFKKTFEEECEFYQTGMQAKYEEYFGDRIIPFTRDGKMLSAIIDRANKRLPPFCTDKNASDKGFKDCLLWLSLLDYFKNNGENQVVFVSDDAGFRNNVEFLCAEFSKVTGKAIVIQPNSYSKELLDTGKPDASAKKNEPTPDFGALRDRIETVIYDLCFMVSRDYWDNELEESIFMVAKKVDVFDIDIFFGGLRNIVQNHILEKSVLTEEVFSLLDDCSPVIHSIAIDRVEKALQLYDDVKEQYPDYLNQFYGAVAAMFNRNYAEPAYTIVTDEELPF